MSCRSMNGSPQYFAAYGHCLLSTNLWMLLEPIPVPTTFIDLSTISSGAIMTWKNAFCITGGCFTNVSRALQNNLAKIHNTRNHIYDENFKLKLETWLWAHVQSFSLKFSSQVLFLQYTNSERIFWRVRETLVKQPPGLFTGILWWDYVA